MALEAASLLLIMRRPRSGPRRTQWRPRECVLRGPSRCVGRLRMRNLVGGDRSTSWAFGIRSRDLDDAQAIPPPPPGFVATRPRGPFSTHNGPYFERASAEGAEQAFFILPRHCNQMGIVHGGMLSAFMDGLLAASVGRAAGAPSV